MKYANMLSFSGINIGEEEKNAISRVFESKWFVNGPECAELEKQIAKLVGVKYCALTNSGSSANFLAFSCISIKNAKVLTSSCGFATTISPVFNLELDPTFVDHDIETLNVDIKSIECELKKSNFDIIIVAHLLGNPVDMDYLLYLKNKYKFILIEDCCEAIGSYFDDKHVGSFGEIGTFSFYPSHQISGFGCGGALVTNNEDYYLKAKSLSTWGKKFPIYTPERHLTSYSESNGIFYDSNYLFENAGWNFQMSEADAAFVLTQLNKLKEITINRRKNWNFLKDKFKNLPLINLKINKKSNPDFFAYPIILDEKFNKRYSRNELAKFLMNKGIITRPFLGGNLTKQPAFSKFSRDFYNSDYIMKNVLFLGIWNEDYLDHTAASLIEYFTTM